MKLLVMALLAAAVLGGCAVVHPWERDVHARRAMIAGFGDTGMCGHFDKKLVETRTGHGAANAAAGGGCGCSQ